MSLLYHSMLYTRVPKFEELRSNEQELYHYDKDIYNKSARKGGKSLYFAKSGETGETWVPLIEKAYAKLHGNYSHITDGQECDAVEDLTGCVFTLNHQVVFLGSNSIRSNNHLRLEASQPSSKAKTSSTPTVSGPKNSYAQTKTVSSVAHSTASTLAGTATKPSSKVSWATTLTPSCVQSKSRARGLSSSGTPGASRSGLAGGRMARKSGRASGWKRCLSLDMCLEMTGSSLWNVGAHYRRHSERYWQRTNVALCDQIRTGWTASRRLIGRCCSTRAGLCPRNGSAYQLSLSLLLGLTVTSRVSVCPPQLDIYPQPTSPYLVTFSISGPTHAVIVLSQIDSRYFRDLAGKAKWSLDYVLVKEGEKEPIAEVAHSEFHLRSVNLEVQLEAGNYIVYVRLDRSIKQTEVRRWLSSRVPWIWLIGLVLCSRTLRKLMRTSCANCPGLWLLERKANLLRQVSLITYFSLLNGELTEMSSNLDFKKE